MRVRLVQGAKDLAAFIELPYRLHRADPIWVPPLRFDVRGRLSRRKNPFFEHGEADYFLAERDGRVVGRIAAIVNRLHNEFHEDKVAFFGFFECEDDPPVAQALLDTVADWARRRGFDVLRGPTSFSTNDECGLLVDGFDTPPTVMMAHNPPYYVDLVESAGFTKARDLRAFEQDVRPFGGKIPERLTRVYEMIRRRARVEVRTADPKRFDQEVERLKRGYNDYWERNWGFVPMTESELQHMVKQLKPFYHPGHVVFIEKDGRLVGLALGLRDLNDVLRTNRSGRLFPAVLKLLWSLRRNRINRLRTIMLGVVPEFRGKGLDALLIHQIWDTSMKVNIEWCECGWILEDNLAMSNAIEQLGFTPYKTYRLYDRKL